MIQNDNEIHNNDKNMTLPDENLLDHLRFFYEMNLKRKSAMEEVIKWTFNKNPQAWWEDAEKKAYAFMKFEPNPDEEAEIEYVGGLLK